MNTYEGKETNESLVGLEREEALAYIKYKIYSEIAEKEKDFELAKHFSDAAKNIEEESRKTLKELKHIGTTQENIKHLNDFLCNDYNRVINKCLSDAEHEGLDNLSFLLNEKRKKLKEHIEKNTEKIQTTGAIAVSADNTEKVPAIFKCENCGYN
ncbi:hypothetical protein LJB90_04140, partial [Eubacteriales bacterium OttesenSCG-928-G02]|nr:hypothetical protein [Eubacteriales bacterium OttesenSCG-928-G02]